MDWTSMVTVGVVVRPQGNRGEFVVDPSTDFGADRFGIGAVLQTMKDGRVVPLNVVTSREHRGRWVVGVAGVTSIDAAEALRGCELRVASDVLHALGPGGYYVHDLLGCVVVTMSGQEVGLVERVDLGPGVPHLVVGPHEVLVPFAEAICRRVDVGARRIEIDPPEGLVELNRGGRE